MEPIPAEIRRFILTSIPSVPYLEALLLMRTDAQARWDSKRLAQRLYIGEKQAAALLATLCSAGIAVCDDSADPHLYSYRPGSEELRVRLDQLADIYARNLVEVTRFIHSKMDRKAQQFADAFTWRKDS